MMTRKRKDVLEASEKAGTPTGIGGGVTQGVREKARADLIRLLVDSVLDEMLADDAGIKRHDGLPASRRKSDQVLVTDQQVVDALSNIVGAHTVSTDGSRIRLQIVGAAAGEWRVVASLRDVVARMLLSGAAVGDPCLCGEGEPKSYLECCHPNILRLAERWKGDLEVYGREQTNVPTRSVGVQKKPKRPREP